MKDVYYLLLDEYLKTPYVGKTLVDPAIFTKERLSLEIELAWEMICGGTCVTYPANMDPDVIKRGIGYVNDILRKQEEAFPDKNELGDSDLEDNEFVLTVRGKENILNAMKATDYMWALTQIKEYLRGKEKYQDWEGRDKEYELLTEIRANVNEIIHDLNLDI